MNYPHPPFFPSSLTFSQLSTIAAVALLLLLVRKNVRVLVNVKVLFSKLLRYERVEKKAQILLHTIPRVCGFEGERNRICKICLEWQIYIFMYAIMLLNTHTHTQNRFNRDRGAIYIDLQPCCCGHGKRVLITNVYCCWYEGYPFSSRFHTSLSCFANIFNFIIIIIFSLI